MGTNTFTFAQVVQFVFLSLVTKGILTEGAPKHKISNRKGNVGTSLVAQWLKIRLPMQGTQVRSLVWEDPTCCGVTKPMCHNY